MKLAETTPRYSAVRSNSIFAEYRLTVEIDSGNNGRRTRDRADGDFRMLKTEPGGKISYAKKTLAIG